jgi:hypothetical protein
MYPLLPGGRLVGGSPNRAPEWPSLAAGAGIRDQSRTGSVRRQRQRHNPLDNLTRRGLGPLRHGGFLYNGVVPSNLKPLMKGPRLCHDNCRSTLKVVAGRKMRRAGHIVAAGLGAMLVGEAIRLPANAAYVPPNGSFSFSFPGPNSSGHFGPTGTLFLGNSASSGARITSFIDPFGGQPNNFCFLPLNGCTAAHPPGFLLAGSEVLFSNPSLPMANVNAPPTTIAETVTVETIIAPPNAPPETPSVDFDFPFVFTSEFTGTTSVQDGSVTLVFLGIFARDSTSQYTLEQSAVMTITCTQAHLSLEIICSGAIDTPAVLEPIGARPRTGIPDPARLGSFQLRHLPEPRPERPLTIRFGPQP